jgi:hypothetical protein
VKQKIILKIFPVLQLYGIWVHALVMGKFWEVLYIGTFVLIFVRAFVKTLVLSGGPEVGDQREQF